MQELRPVTVQIKRISSIKSVSAEITVKGLKFDVQKLKIFLDRIGVSTQRMIRTQEGKLVTETMRAIYADCVEQLKLKQILALDGVVDVKVLD